MKIKADLHIHSTLSPCASLEMSPSAIVRRARELGLDLIAVTDHNCMENGFYAAAAGAKLGLTVWFGMEAQTREEVHVLCLFDDKKKAERFNREIYDFLPAFPNNPDFFGDQVVVDEQDNIVRTEPKLLINALELSITELVEMVRRRGGRVIPAHVESMRFGLLAMLGVIPPELVECLFEVTYSSREAEVIERFPELAGRALVANSDSHSLSEMGRAWTVYDSPQPTLKALYQAGLDRCFKTERKKRHG